MSKENDGGEVVEGRFGEPTLQPRRQPLRTKGECQHNRVEVGIEYLRRGWSLIPCCSPARCGPGCREHGADCSKPGKRSLLKTWERYQRTRPSEATVLKWWDCWPNANVALITGAVSGIVVVDCDSPETINVAAKMLGDTPAPSVLTHRGQHFYFAAPADVRLSNAVRIGSVKGLDFRGEGGYVIAPPSSHPAGGVYRWLVEPGVELPPLPAALIEMLPTSARGQRSYRLRPELLKAALDNLSNAIRRPNGAVSCSCPHPDHDDIHPSAVVHPDGTLHCTSYCGKLWPPQEWSRWPGCEWAQPFVRDATSGAKARRTEAAVVPRVAIRNASEALKPHPNVAAIRKRGDVWDLTGWGGPAGNLEALCQAIKSAAGPLAQRVLLASVLLAQVASDRGRFPYSAPKVALALGYSPGQDGRPSSRVRDKVHQTYGALCKIKVCFRFSARTRDWFKGSILTPLGKYGQGWQLVQLHPGIWHQLASGRACVPIDPRALQLEDYALSMFLLAVWETEDRGRDLSGPLDVLAARAGVWNEARASKDPGRLIKTWKRRLARIPALGLADIEWRETGSRLPDLTIPLRPAGVGVASRRSGCGVAESASGSLSLPTT